MTRTRVLKYVAGVLIVGTLATAFFAAGRWLGEGGPCPCHREGGGPSIDSNEKVPV